MTFNALMVCRQWLLRILTHVYSEIGPSGMCEIWGCPQWSCFNAFGRPMPPLLLSDDKVWQLLSIANLSSYPYSIV
jgi:hypothetical protein